uniref:Putative metal-dependent membrane protease n=1 Tax=Rheinheimera sp. BAL341 TaxID=1708203 RepID=A0A486XHN4_9GAMM
MLSVIESIKAVVVKLLLMFTVIVLAVAAYRWLVLPALQIAFELNEPATALLRRLGILLVILLAYGSYVRFYDKRPVKELHFPVLRVCMGLLSGAGMIALVSALLFAFGIYEVTAYRGWQTGLLDVALVILVAAIIEEIVFRAVLFQAMESQWGTVAALWLQSLIFSLLHIANLDTQMNTLALGITVLSGTLIGAFWTILYVYVRNVWVVAAHHAAWNFTVVLTGLPLSGLSDWQGLAPLQSVYQGANWLTGGAVGPEDSVVTIVMVIIAVFAMVWLAQKQDRFYPAAAAVIKQ